MPDVTCNPSKNAMHVFSAHFFKQNVSVLQVTTQAHLVFALSELTVGDS